MAVAVKVLVCPLATDEMSGVMLMPVSAAVLTVRLAEGDAIPFNEAEIFALPADRPVAIPVLLLIEEIELLLVDQTTWLVRLAVEPSE